MLAPSNVHHLLLPSPHANRFITGTAVIVINNNFIIGTAIINNNSEPALGEFKIPDGLVVQSCTSHPGVLGLIPKREEPRKTRTPCVKAYALWCRGY
jgi:hypothetical protein